MRTSLPVAIVLAVLLGACAEDPCEGGLGPPSLVLGGADESGVTFEPFSPGGERDLVAGPQLGLHVWMHARTSGICPTSTILDRRVVSEDGQLLQFGRGPVGLVDGPEEGVYELDQALPLIVCPSSLDRSVVGAPLRFEVTATDMDGRRAEATLAFVPRCPDGVDCDTFCSP